MCVKEGESIHAISYKLKWYKMNMQYITWDFTSNTINPYNFSPQALISIEAYPS